MSGGKGGGAGGDAAAAEAEANLAATEEIRRQFDITQANISPFLQAGLRALPATEQQSTLGGLDAFFNQLFGGAPLETAATRGATTTAAGQQINPAFTDFEARRQELQSLIDTEPFTGGLNFSRPNIGGLQVDSDRARLGITSPDASSIELAQQELDALGAAPSQFLPGGAPALATQVGGGDGRGGLQQALGALINERGRAVQGQLAAGGLTRSGTALQEAARIPTDLGFQIEQLLSGRTSNLSGSGQNAAATLGQFGAEASGGIAGLTRQTGQAQSSGILADQQARAQGQQNFINTAATIGSIFFSDPALKENVEEIGETGDLKIYQWDWIEETKETMIADCGTIGFMADEVKEKYPQHIYEFGGFMMIDYPELLNELQEAA